MKIIKNAGGDWQLFSKTLAGNELNFIMSTSYAQCTFLNIKPKMCFNVTIDEDFMIFD